MSMSMYSGVAGYPVAPQGGIDLNALANMAQQNSNAIQYDNPYPGHSVYADGESLPLSPAQTVQNQVRQAQVSRMQETAKATPIYGSGAVTQPTPHQDYMGMMKKAHDDALNSKQRWNIKPPEDKDITWGMWLGSAMVSLFVGATTGNIGQAISAGGLAALNIHDQGYARQEREKECQKLLDQGYSYDAVYQWYESGDNKTLMKDRELMEKRQMHEEDRQDKFKLEEMKENQALSMEQMREDNAYKLASMREAGANARAAMSHADAQRNHLDSVNSLNQNREVGQIGRLWDDSKENVKRVQGQLGGWTDAANLMAQAKHARSVLDNPHSSPAMQEQAKTDLTALMPSLTHAVARGEVGGNATLNEQQLKDAMPNLGYVGNTLNKSGQGWFGGDGMTDEAFNAMDKQIQHNQKAANEVYNQRVSQFENGAAQVSGNPELAHSYASALYAQTGNAQPVTPSKAQDSAGPQYVGDAPVGVPDGQVMYKGKTAHIVNGKVYQ